MSGQRRKAVVVCPGRGVYGQSELGALKRYGAHGGAFVAPLERLRRDAGQTSLAALDGAERYDVDTYTRGDNAAALIYACSMVDFAAIDRERIDVVAVTGNSMGWYTALACAGALAPEPAARVVNTMGGLTHTMLVGGQMLTPFVDEEWREQEGLRARLEEIVADAPPSASLHVSIRLGGMIVVAGDEADLAHFGARMPKAPKPYPMRLVNHAAFHSPLMAPIAARARSVLGADLFSPPALPMIDGAGRIWRPGMSRRDALWAYTFGDQITTTYDFARAIHVAVREFAPDCLILLGPGSTLGGAIAQSLIQIRWRGLDSKTTFASRQESDPFVLSMAREAQRAEVARA